MTQSGPTHRP